MNNRRKRRIPPEKARRAVLGGFYDRVEVTRAGWPTCSACGRKTSLVDPERGECLRCQLERRKAAREASA